MPAANAASGSFHQGQLPAGGSADRQALQDIRPALHHRHPDAEIVDELDPKPGDFQIRKKHYSAFNSTRLDAVLRELDIKRLYFTGAWTEACVQHTVIDAFYLNYDISVISDAVSSPHRDAHDYALNICAVSPR
jgi:nicotinamidase-related amidase